MCRMSIKHAVLGVLSCKLLTGYDLKKIMQESPFMYWSGNNNQIYKTLLELQDDGFVTNEVYHQDSSPSKKVYTITDAGRAELKRWSKSEPEAPEIKKTFLIQLAWADQLSSEELEELLSRYEQEIKGQIAVTSQKVKKGYFAPDRTKREIALWGLIYENVVSSLINELNWIEKIRQTVNSLDTVTYGKPQSYQQILSGSGEKEIMPYKVIKKDNQIYLLLEAVGKPISTEQDGLELISLCAENKTNHILIQGERLSNDFLCLGTGVAGAIMQKFMLYNIKAAAVLDIDKAKSRFKEFLTESNHGNFFRAYPNFEDAENWLLSTK